VIRVAGVGVAGSWFDSTEGLAPVLRLAAEPFFVAHCHQCQHFQKERAISAIGIYLGFCDPCPILLLRVGLIRLPGSWRSGSLLRLWCSAISRSDRCKYGWRWCMSLLWRSWDSRVLLRCRRVSSRHHLPDLAALRGNIGILLSGHCHLLRRQLAGKSCVGAWRPHVILQVCNHVKVEVRCCHVRVHLSTWHVEVHYTGRPSRLTLWQRRQRPARWIHMRYTMLSLAGRVGRVDRASTLRR
jgi:hypothetical protein